MIILSSVIVSLIALSLAGFWAFKFRKTEVKSEKVREIAGYIRVSAKAYIKREYKVIGLVAIPVFFALLFIPGLGFNVALGFFIGAVASALAGYIGVLNSVYANAVTAEASMRSEKEGFFSAFRGGAVTGLMVCGLALLVLSVFYYFTKDLSAIIGLGFGGSLLSVFARIGGGIFTKAADVGADLVGKIEVGIPEDDPRNPAVIADNVGDNVGDCAGMAADLFETYVISTLSAMLLGSLMFPNFDGIILFPLVVGGVGVAATIISVLASSFIPYMKVMKNLYCSVGLTILLSAIFLFPVSSAVINGNIQYSILEVYFSILVGFALVAGMFFVTDYYTSKNFSPVKRIAKASTGGHATNIITGIGVGFEATALPVMLISIGIIVSFWLAGVYGVALAVMGMLSLAGIVVAVDAFGPIADNAGGIAEMSGFPKEARKSTDILDSAGNTTKAVTKGYAIASAGLAALVLFVSFREELSVMIEKGVKFSIDDPYVLVGLFLGGVASYLFASLLMFSVGKTAGAVVEEVRRQFREIPGLREGTAKPDYEKTVDIVTKSSIREMILPALIPVVAPIIIGLKLGPEALGGFLVGAITVGLFLALSMTSGGGAWDNAKKFIEDGNYGGKGSEAHKAAVTGDTVGDPYKDTVGPAINPMIKVLNLVALLIVGLLA
ncbi:MAG: sodium-translocating pyrophosphatase [Candidatus Spechtbacteria bacterium RIFCSPHIGHO2_01_FULL_43_30]|uniref:K(+)-insensitive pyrophosphate-energized proton pump n=1 Tax=Candidatus Spechtbacteria bacterium RIFCSPHIGHO2_01_FULL_43_30 TaxID=1802158 RepID=A0A1G2H5H7_9BACT|nr:MAG: sodium-translocating pyrophosphatase [Candidatus Spechtbacteria bacterium RIFCSPHIGHO2_01_FULL_43_30]